MIPKVMYVEYCGAYAREAKAVALAESLEDVVAISPGGLGCGILQQSAEWQATYPPTMPPLTSRLFGHAMSTDRRWHPAFQLACYASFCLKAHLLAFDARLRLYHYGHLTADDPDNYVSRVMREWGQLAEW